MEKIYTMKTRPTKYKEGVERYNLFNSITYDELVLLCNSYRTSLRSVNDVLATRNEKNTDTKCNCGRKTRNSGTGKSQYEYDIPSIIIKKTITSDEELCDMQEYYTTAFDDATHEIKLLKEVNK